MKRLLGILSLAALLGGYATPLTAREKEALGGGALGASGSAAVGDQMESQNQHQDIQAYEADQQRRAIEWQRRELEDLRRDGYDHRGYDSRPNDRDYNRDYERGDDRNYHLRPRLPVLVLPDGAPQ